MQNRFPKDKKNFNQKTQHFRSLLIWVLAFFIIAQLISLFSQGIRNKEYLSYSQFYRILKENKEHPL